MKKVLQRSRIKGMSFRSSVTISGRSSRHKKDLDHFADPVPTPSDKGAPAPLLRADIARLLNDIGRHELHALVSECIEHCSHWRQISRTLERHAETSALGANRHQENEGTTAFTNAINTEALIESRKNFSLWHHRLTMLEWIAAAQSSMQWEQILKQKSAKRQTE